MEWTGLMAVVGALATPLAGWFAMTLGRRYLPGRSAAWRAFVDRHGLDTTDDPRHVTGAIDGLAFDLRVPDGGYGPFPTATVLALATGRSGVHLCRRSTPSAPEVTGDADFDRRCRAVAPRGAHHELHHRLREAWLAADEVAFAEVGLDGQVVVAVPGRHPSADELEGALHHLRALAAARLEPPSPRTALRGPEPAPFVARVLRRLAVDQPRSARQAATELRDHPTATVRVACAEVLGPDALLRELHTSPSEVLSLLPDEVLPVAGAQLGTRPLAARYGGVRALALRPSPAASEALTRLLGDQLGRPVPSGLDALWRTTAEALAEAPTAEALPLLRHLLTVADTEACTHAVDAIASVGTPADIPALRDLPARVDGARIDDAVARIQARHPGRAGALSVPPGPAGRLSVATRAASPRRQRPHEDRALSGP